ncbi:MAG: DJ-1 family protein [Salinivirgaceae bacterium]|nr:MAG: DJ-1 family protein [Salinivirgaceae bacterium]
MKKILLLLAEGFEIYEASVFIDVMGWNYLEGDHSTELFTCGLRKEIKSSFDQNFITDFTVDEIDLNSFDALAIPGGFEEYRFYKDAYSEPFSRTIKHFTDAGKMVATICVGALPLAKTGVLKNKNATTYNSPKRREALKDFGANVLHQPIVFEDNIITSWNPSTAVDVAFLLLEHLTSKENAENVRKLMGF